MRKKTFIAFSLWAVAALPLAFRIAHAFGGTVEDVFRYDNERQESID